MKPIEFPEQNVVFAKDQPEYSPLPAHRSDDGYGRVLTIWEPTDEELSEIVRTKRIYLSQLTFQQPLQPVILSGHRTTFFEDAEQQKPKNFQPYDPEWESEMMKWDKTNLIGLLRRVLIEKDGKENHQLFVENSWVDVSESQYLEGINNNFHGRIVKCGEVVSSTNTPKKERSEAEKKAEADFHYWNTGGHNGPTGHGDTCMSDADNGM